MLFIHQSLSRASCTPLKQGIIVALLGLSLVACTTDAPPPTTVSPTPTDNSNNNYWENQTNLTPDGTLSEQGQLERNQLLTQYGSVYFDIDSNVVLPQYKETVDAHIRFMKKYPTQRLILQGNTDETGSKEYNLGLGTRRSESVKRMMNLSNVSQVEAVSFGESNPKSLGRTPEDYAQNRRVDFVYR